MLTGLGSISTTTERLAGYQRALREANIHTDDRLVVSGESTSDGGAEALNSVMDLETPPTAIFSGNNLMSIGALQTIARRGLNVPDELAIVGFDDFPFPWSEAFRPQLTTVAQPTYELERRAAEMLVRQLSGAISEPAQRVVLEGTLVIRESSGAFTRPLQREGPERYAAAGDGD
jgi:DNA-binding LacI/PurR family transcriptional regulator